MSTEKTSKGMKALNHCQICGRPIKDKFGVIAHHGFKRKWGSQTSSCIGARELPYERSRDVIPRAIKRADDFILGNEKSIVRIEQEKLPVPQMGVNKPLMESSDPLYSIRQKEFIAKLNSEIFYAKKERDFLQKRYDDGVRMMEGYESTDRKVKDGVFGKVLIRDVTPCPRCREKGEFIKTETHFIIICKHCDFSMGSPRGGD